MFNDASGFHKIYLATGYTDLHRGINGLASIVKQHLIDTIDGAKASAIVYSLTETAKANQLNPFRYLEFLLTELLEHQDDTNQDFFKDLLLRSEQIPEICKIKTSV